MNEFLNEMLFIKIVNLKKENVISMLAGCSFIYVYFLNGNLTVLWKKSNQRCFHRYVVLKVKLHKRRGYRERFR